MKREGTMREFHFYAAEKATWGDGPWIQEPDKVQWVDEQTGLDCLAVRNESMGFWCGYVGVPELHPSFGKSYDDVEVEVHGGLTFADVCMEGSNAERGVCHVAEPGRPEHVWWLGFDTGHAWDLAPAYEMRYPSLRLLRESRAYRDLNYVKTECRDLARQLAAAPS